MPTSALPRTTHRRAGGCCSMPAGTGGRRDGERADGRDTKRQGGGLIAALVELQQATAGELDFAHLARTRAVRTLQERCGHDVSAETINELVEAGLEITGNVIRRQLN